MEPEREEMWRLLRNDPLVAPSLLSADFTRLADEISCMEKSGARVLHLDVMDGHFVPNITFGPPLVEAVRRKTNRWLDVHLMVTDPLSFLDAFAKAGAESITVHAEAGPDIRRCRTAADRLGIRLGLAIRPDSPILETLEERGAVCDLILIMTVMPGFGGQSYRDGSGARIREAASWCAKAPRQPVLEVDGGIRAGTAADAAANGARWLVAGNAIFRSVDPAAAFRDLTREVGDAYAG